MHIQSAATLIRAARGDAGLTQAQLAERMGVSQATVSKLESPRSNPRIATLRRAIAATGKALDLQAGPARATTVDESMIAANLRRTPAERLAEFHRAYRGMRRLAPTVRSDG